MESCAAFRGKVCLKRVTFSLVDAPRAVMTTNYTCNDSGSLQRIASNIGPAKHTVNRTARRCCKRQVWSPSSHEGSPCRWLRCVFVGESESMKMRNGRAKCHAGLTWPDEFNQPLYYCRFFWRNGITVARELVRQSSDN
jgi:hypothetical protein